MIKRCPMCGGDQFIVSPHVVQDWIVDEYGNFIQVSNEFVDFAHKIDDSDLWTCFQCGYENEGRNFNVKE